MITVYVRKALGNTTYYQHKLSILDHHYNWIVFVDFAAMYHAWDRKFCQLVLSSVEELYRRVYLLGRCTGRQRKDRKPG